MRTGPPLLKVEHRGAAKDVKARFVVDCSGRNAVLAKKYNLQEFDEKLHNIAIFGYFKNAHWRYQYNGYENFTKILVHTTHDGWLWFIPIRSDLVSIGLVTRKEYLPCGRSGIRDHFLSTIRGCSMVFELLHDATLQKGIGDDPDQDLFIEKAWSYRCRQMTGPGWTLCGDAAVFIDPILSSGCLLAHLSGYYIATALNSLWDEPDLYSHPLWKIYEELYGAIADNFLHMALVWYSANFTAKRWHETANQELRERHGLEMPKSADAFLAISGGYACDYRFTNSVAGVGWASFNIPSSNITKNLFTATPLDSLRLQTKVRNFGFDFDLVKAFSDSQLRSAYDSFQVQPYFLPSLPMPRNPSPGKWRPVERFAFFVGDHEVVLYGDERLREILTDLESGRARMKRYDSDLDQIQLREHLASLLRKKIITFEGWAREHD